MEWLDYGDCVGDDPLKWDLDHVEVDDVQGYARKVCSDCPVRRECAESALTKHDVGEIFNRVVTSVNPGLAIGDRVESEGYAAIRQYGVIRGGVALVGDYESELYAVAGREWHGFKDCTGCGRPVYRGRTPVEDRPEGSVRAANKGRCQPCAEGGVPRNGRSGITPQREAKIQECMDLFASGLKLGAIADRMQVRERTVQRYLAAGRANG